MFKNYKYALLLTLLCSAQSPAHAGWFYNLLGQVARSVYPLNMVIGITDDLKKLRLDLKIPVNNTQEQRKYPLATAYVQNQLRNVKINPDGINLVNKPHIKNSGALFRTLLLPLATFENALSQSPRETNQIKGATAHEIEHLRRHLLLKIMATRLLILGGIETCSHYLPFMPTKLWGNVTKTLCSTLLFTAFMRHEEYCADSAAIKQLKKSQQALLDWAVLFLNFQQSEIIKALHRNQNAKVTAREIKISSHPVVRFFSAGEHPSSLSRANRLIREAGIPCNQKLLSTVLARHITMHVFQKKYAADTAPIIDVLKQSREKIIADYGIDPGPSPIEQAKDLDAAEMPYPLQIYGL